MKEKNYYYDVYVRPWTHSQTFFLGMILGYVLSEIPGKIKINKVSCPRQDNWGCVGPL